MICTWTDWRDSTVQDSELIIQAGPGRSEEHRSAPGTQGGKTWPRTAANRRIGRAACARRRQGHPHRTGIIEAMSTSSSRRFPVTVTQLPVTRCQICRRTVAYRPGGLTQVLTEHYRRVHPEALGLPSR